MATPDSPRHAPAESVRNCDRCKGPIAANGVMAGFRITVRRRLVDGRNARRLAGMTQFFGGAPKLAEVMTGVDGSNLLLEPAELTRDVVLCEPCFLEHPASVLEVYWTDDSDLEEELDDAV